MGKTSEAVARKEIRTIIRKIFKDCPNIKHFSLKYKDNIFTWGYEINHLKFDDRLFSYSSKDNSDVSCMAAKIKMSELSTFKNLINKLLTSENQVLKQELARIFSSSGLKRGDIP